MIWRAKQAGDAGIARNEGTGGFTASRRAPAGEHAEAADGEQG